MLSARRLLVHAPRSRIWRSSLGAAAARRFIATSADETGNPVKPFYITTPIFYPNSGAFYDIHSVSFIQLRLILPPVPHIGHLYSLVVADVFARHARLTAPEREVRFVSGTDEHGMKIQKAAAERGVTPLALCDALSVKFRVRLPLL